jgi:hypothetical protein
VLPVQRVQPRLGRALLALILFGGAACYDSRWGEAKRAQQRAAVATKPADITPSSSSSGPVAQRRTLRIRVRPNDRYLAQTIDAPKQIADLVEDANRVLGPTVDAEIEVDRMQPWSNETDDPGAALAALNSEDPGADVDVVVGMIGALSRQTDSLHELGVSTLLGKHVVVRAASRFEERDAVEQRFSELSEDDRARIASQRKRHRALAVFLHELGHTFGAIHEVDIESLMHPSYDPKMSGFGGGSIALMRVAIRNADPVAVAREQLDILRTSTGADWVESERNQEIARLETMLPRAPATNTVAGPAAPSNPAPPPELRGDDAARFQRASDLFQAGAVAAAYAAAKPLLAAYPDVAAVQSLRCQLATVRWLDAAALKSECAPSLRLLAGPDAGADAAR